MSFLVEVWDSSATAINRRPIASVTVKTAEDAQLVTRAVERLHSDAAGAHPVLISDVAELSPIFRGSRLDSALAQVTGAVRSWLTYGTALAG